LQTSSLITAWRFVYFVFAFGNFCYDERFCGDSYYCYLYVFCQGLILSKALKAQKDVEDESNQIAIGNLRSEVISLRNEALENDKILVSLVERLKSSEARLSSLSEAEQKMKELEEKQQKDVMYIADLEYALSVQVRLYISDVQGLEKKLDEVTENFNIEQTKCEISDTERLRVQKNIKELRRAKEECYNVAMECCNKLKKIALPKLAHSLRSKILFATIMMGLFVGSAARPKLLTKFSVIEKISAPSSALTELCHSLRRLAASMQRL
jgi:hypothetical protein